MYVCEVWTFEICLEIDHASAVIIGINDVVYAVCKCARRFNPSPRHIKELVSLKSGRLSVNLMFMECRLVSPKFRKVFRKLLSVECMSISLNFRGYFVKLRFTKAGVLLQNCYPWTTDWFHQSSRDFSQNLGSQQFLSDSTDEKFWPMRECVQLCTGNKRLR